jgi:rubrerythrin
MAYQINLEEVDTDGAIREAAEAVSGDTRMDFIRKAGLTGGAVVGGGAILSALTAPSAFAASSGRPPASFGKGDIGILNYALTLEYLERAFYEEAVASGALTDPHLAALAAKIKKDEEAHVAFLQTALGKKAVKKPKFDFKGTTSNQAMFAATSQVLENTGVGAYFGQGFNIKAPAILKDAISILTVEARHAGAIGFYNDATAAAVSPNGAFDVPYTAAKVLKAVTGTGFIV